MDAIRVAKVEDVLSSKAGSTRLGTLHLTAHHLILQSDEHGGDEMWVPYPLISLVTRLPQTLDGKSPLIVHTRTFETFSLSFRAERSAADVFDSIKELTVASDVTHLYAFFYTPNPPFPVKNGWNVYSPREEFGRMGIGTRTKAWRFTDINKDYSFSPTYPARLVVPTRISDATLQYAAKYRSKARIPALTYLHWANYGSITRSSQPMVGITQNRSIQDEKLIEAIFQTHWSPDSRALASTVYGATATNLIIDARPTTNAMANTAKGAGTENMDNYKDAKKAYLGIDHIHVMRESLAKVVEALREAEAVTAAVSGNLPGESSVMPILDRQALRRSGWLRHISTIMEGTLLIIRNVHINSSHVLIHCSDGWDRTAQLSSLAQVCLDPFYRTLRGFQILVEKDWVSFGHKFLDRCGHLSSDKFFVASAENAGAGGGAEAAQAFLASVQNRFASQNHIKEMSPVFHQFLECVRQVQRQNPERFEFNERFLRKLHYHLYSCQFGTFLFNTERDRRTADAGVPACERTTSVWDLFNSPPEVALNINPDYSPSLNDPLSRAPNADQGVLIPNPKDVKFWHELYRRTDEEMNGKFIPPVAQPADAAGPTEDVENDAIRELTPLNVSIPPSPAISPVSRTDTPSSGRLTVSRAPSPLPPPPPPSHDDIHSQAAPHARRSRHESLRGFEPSSASQISMRTQGSAGSYIPSPSSSSSRPVRPSASQPQELFSSGAVKSIWGRFSSNALSVVQDAYGGVSKGLEGLTLAAGSVAEETREGGGELKTREEISVWKEERAPSPGMTRTVRDSVSTNPWSTARSRPPIPSSLLEENPWSSVRASSPRPLQQTPDDSQSNLPMDPTVALPSVAPLNPQRFRTMTPSSTMSGMNLPSRSIAATPPPTSTDPLGVGLL